MKLILVAFAILSSGWAFSAPVKVVTARGEGFELTKEGQLTLVGSAKSAKARLVGAEEMRSIESRALGLVWDSRQLGKCSLYATVEAGGEKARICEESLSATGATYGLLQKVRSKFQP